MVGHEIYGCGEGRAMLQCWCGRGRRRGRVSLLTALFGSSTINCPQHRSRGSQTARASRATWNGIHNPPGVKEACVRLLIAIPVFNERRYVESVLAEVKRYAHEVLCIDDGSTDGTGELLEQLAARGEIRLVRHATNRGYGQSIIDAFDYADARDFDWVITMDCDEQHEPARIPDFVREIRTNEWDVISGSRYLGER